MLDQVFNDTLSAEEVALFADDCSIAFRAGAFGHPVEAQVALVESLLRIFANARLVGAETRGARIPHQLELLVVSEDAVSRAVFRMSRHL